MKLFKFLFNANNALIFLIACIQFVSLWLYDKNSSYIMFKKFGFMNMEFTQLYKKINSNLFL